MSDSRRELVSRPTRREIRDMMSGTVLREIGSMWQDEGFPPPEDGYPTVGGDRVSLFQAYLDKVDWTDDGHTARALRVFEIALHGIDRQYLGKVILLLERDGYTLREDGRIVGGPQVSVREGALAAVDDPAVIRDHLERIGRAIDAGDISLAIGSAKELIESTAKLVLTERGLPADDRDDVPKLVRDAQVALGVHPTTISGPDGVDAVRKILGGSVSIATGLAELRNRAGTGHGRGAPTGGLGTRHARLAVGGARLWCEFMLDTLADPAAPWRKGMDGSAGLPAAGDQA